MADTKEEEKGTWYVFRDGAIRQFSSAVTATTEAKKGGYLAWVPLGANILEYVPGNGNARRRDVEPGEAPPGPSPAEISDAGEP